MKQKKRMKEGLIPAEPLATSLVPGNGGSSSSAGSAVQTETTMAGSSENSTEST